MSFRTSLRERKQVTVLFANPKGSTWRQYLSHVSVRDKRNVAKLRRAIQVRRCEGAAYFHALCPRRLSFGHCAKKSSCAA